MRKESITDELRLIKGSSTDYITPQGQVYKDYGNGWFFPKKNFVNHHNGYVYTGITYPDKQQQRRVHVLVAEVYLDNPNNYPYVMHKDNNKLNNDVSNLQWGNASMNTKAAYDDGLAENARGFDDSQSMPVCCFDEQYRLKQIFGSVGEATRQIGVTKTGILYQCNHLMKTYPRKGYYYRFLSEYLQEGFVL